MATSISELKKKRSKRFDELKDKLSTSESNSNRNKDERFWYPDVDKSGNGFSIIRFLDSPKGEDNPYIKMFSHSVKGPGGWYIENCPTTIGKECPTCKFNTRLWNSGVESDKDIVRSQKRKLSYISNILVVKDPSNPDNEGKVFLYRYGQKIHAKINDKANPEFEDEDPVNVFDFWEGANFRLKIRHVAGYRNYDKSEFDEPSALFDGDDSTIEKLWESEYKLGEFIDPSNFKSYEELHARLVKVLGFDPESSTLMRPGDVDTSPQHEQTAQRKITQKIDSGSDDDDDVPVDFKKSSKSNDDSDEDDDFFEDIASKL